jgi:ketosteroid isomerase-like protein
MIEDELLKWESEFAQAVARNDVNALDRFLDDEWVIVDPDGGIIDKERFLSVIGSGVLSHESMNSTEVKVRLFGDTAVVTALTTTTGNFMNKNFTSCERATDVFIKQPDRWRCVFTQLTRFNKK